MKQVIELKRKTYEELQQTVIELITEKCLLEKALDKACDVITELNDCANLVSEKYEHCPFEKEGCLFHDLGCVSNKDNWKEWCMKDE